MLRAKNTLLDVADKDRQKISKTEPQHRCGVENEPVADDETGENGGEETKKDDEKNDE